MPCTDLVDTDTDSTRTEPHPDWCGCDDCLAAEAVSDDDCDGCTAPGCGHPDPCDDCARAGGWF
jgi:hypothetical protein